jgi:formate hydrogenlyase subunit 4
MTNLKLTAKLLCCLFINIMIGMGVQQKITSNAKLFLLSVVTTLALMFISGLIDSMFKGDNND